MNNKRSVQEKETNTSEEYISYTRKYSFYYVAAAVMIIAILVSQYFQKEPNPQDLYAAYFQPFKIVKDSITSDLQNQPEFETALKAYNLKDYYTASIQFDHLLSNSKDAHVTFYNAMSHLNNGDFTSAQAIMDRLKKERSNYQADLYWYSALISLKQSNKREAIIQLDSLKLVNSGYRRKASQAILKQLTE